MKFIESNWVQIEDEMARILYFIREWLGASRSDWKLRNHNQFDSPMRE